MQKTGTRLGDLFIIAGHWFKTLRPGERCCGDGCSVSLVDLMNLAEHAEVGDQGVAHMGALNHSEMIQLKEARAAYRAECAALF